MRVKRRKQKGFTLMELLAVIAIMAIIGNVVMSLFISSQKAFVRTNNQNIIQDEGRMVIEFIETDLKVGKRISVTETPGIFGSVKIDGRTYSCGFAPGQEVKPIFAYKMKETNPSNPTGPKIDVTYAYVKVDKQLIKGKVSGNSLTKMGTLSKNLKDISVTNTKPYEVKFTLENVGNNEEFYSTVTPRNN